MRNRDFAFWLQGFFELGGADDGLTVQQVAIIKQHLGLVFRHDPEMGAPAHPLVAPEQWYPAPLNPSSILIC